MMKKLSALLLALMFLTFANSASAGDWFKIVKTLSTGEKVELAIEALKLTAKGIKAFCADAVNPKQCETDAAITVGTAVATTTGVAVGLAGAGAPATLAAIGGAVGGGMAAGAVVMVAAPVVIVGGLLYWMVSD